MQLRLFVFIFLSLLCLNISLAAEPRYDILYELTDNKEDILTESNFGSVISNLQRTFRALSIYMYETNRKNPEDAVFLWDSYDNPPAYDLEKVSSLYEKIRERWGPEIINADYLDFLKETDSRFLGYLKALKEPYNKLGKHISALNSAYKKAVEKLEAMRKNSF